MAHDINSGKQFNDGEIKLLSRFAQLASLVLDNAQLYTTAQEEKKRSNDLLNVVIPIGVALSAEQNFDRLLEKILLEAKSFCNSDGGTLYLRTDSEDLKFVIVRNDSLDIAMGGTSGRPIDFPAVSLYDEVTGEPNHSNVAAHVALTGTSINIHDAYEAEGFNFSGTKTFDQSTGYRSTSFLTLPLKNAYDQVVGVLQLINALEPHTGRVIPFDPSLEQIVGSLSSLATVALEAYKRERSLRQQIQQLRIEIDEVKRKKQVTEIIETDFFQDLQDKAREIRRRSKSNRFEKPE
jgi:GAF domain-containing protein